LAGAVVGITDTQVTVVTSRGITKTMRLRTAPATARARQGDRVIALRVRDQVAGVVTPVFRPEGD